MSMDQKRLTEIEERIKLEKHYAREGTLGHIKRTLIFKDLPDLLAAYRELKAKLDDHLNCDKPPCVAAKASCRILEKENERLRDLRNRFMADVATLMGAASVHESMAEIVDGLKAKYVEPWKEEIRNETTPQT